MAAARVAAAVVGNEPVSMGQGWLGQEGSESVRDERTVNKNHGLTRTRDLVLKRDAIYDRFIHTLSSSDVRFPPIPMEKHLRRIQAALSDCQAVNARFLQQSQYRENNIAHGLLVLCGM
jgi:hypothetical protein